MSFFLLLLQLHFFLLLVVFFTTVSQFCTFSFFGIVHINFVSTCHCYRLYGMREEEKNNDKRHLHFVWIEMKGNKNTTFKWFHFRLKWICLYLCGCLPSTRSQWHCCRLHSSPKRKSLLKFVLVTQVRFADIELIKHVPHIFENDTLSFDGHSIQFL